MPTILCHRGRTVTTDDLETIRALLMAHPDASRRAFSQRLCEHWDWRQANGALRDMVCRSLLLARVKTMLDLHLLHSGPKYLGPKIAVGGDA